MNRQTMGYAPNDPPKNINNGVILTVLLRNKAFRPVKLKYDMNYHCINVLLLCYYYSVRVNGMFTKRGVDMFKYYGSKSLKYFFGVLEDKGLITLASVRGSWKYYRLTTEGFRAVALSQESYDKALYEFCNKYNITL